MALDQIIKRDGQEAPFDRTRIEEAIWAAAKAANAGESRLWAETLSWAVCGLLEQRQVEHRCPPHVEEIQDIVEEVLVKAGNPKIAKMFILYREKRAEAREGRKNLLDGEKLVSDYLQASDWRVSENSNMNYSLQGLNFYLASSMTANYWLGRIYPPEVQQAHKQGDLHLHDLGVFSVYCCGWDLHDLLQRGFGGVSSKIESRPPRHLRVALGQLVNFFYTLQGEAAGAVAVSNFDTLLAPFIRFDGLDYPAVRQAVQEFVFNLNVPTRVGFQCLSEDTEVLTPEGWKGYEDVKVGDIIKTFNVSTGAIEDQPILRQFANSYTGQMYHLRNRIQDQLISPGHRVVRKKFNTDDQFVLEEIEQVLKYKSPVIMPVTGKNTNEPKEISDEEIRLLAWIIAEGSKESYTSHRHSNRISIYQSQFANPESYADIVSVLNLLGLDYRVQNSTPALGGCVQNIRLNAGSSHRILDTLFGTRESIKFIPPKLRNMDRRQARLFLDTYIKADGHEGYKITTTNVEILNGLQHVAVDAEYGFTVSHRKPTIGRRPLYILRLIDHQDTYIQKIEAVDYSGIIWCPTTVNETVIARRNGKAFITGNTPFTNITLDLTPPSHLASQAVIVGGEPQNAAYDEFQVEMNMLNRAFAEVMLEGDARNRVLTFPIPTYNLSQDFDWENPVFDGIWRMTARYGIPYFANFINSDMKPEDTRSMCCRLRLDNRELNKRLGGIFASAPLTGSVGVVTLNLPRLAFQASSETDFFQRLERQMEIGRISLEIKRKTLETLTQQGLYPYSRHYLGSVYRRTGAYWSNHFATIGLLGMHEACLNFLGVGIDHPQGSDFAQKTLETMLAICLRFQEETGHLYNLEATPAEGASYRLARLDRQSFPSIRTSGTGSTPYYTNSTQLPVGYSDDLFATLQHQDRLQCLYTGGTVQHIFLGEELTDWKQARLLIRRAAETFRLPYFTLTPTFSVCPVHGYLTGEHPFCPHEHPPEVTAAYGNQVPCEVYSRVVGYIRPVQNWNKGKQQEFRERLPFDSLKILDQA
ncbi:MAG: ribonucleoside triphosphate reductase [Anaerolineae bacterium]|nr:ribonucleoside triphosphate reductase [Anaerolineae bacterium]